jgi:hypothetical protein
MRFTVLRYRWKLKCGLVPGLLLVLAVTETVFLAANGHPHITYDQLRRADRATSMEEVESILGRPADIILTSEEVARQPWAILVRELPFDLTFHRWISRQTEDGQRWEYRVDAGLDADGHLWRVYPDRHEPSQPPSLFDQLASWLGW